MTGWRIRQSLREFESQRDFPYTSDGDISVSPTNIGLRSGTSRLSHWVNIHHRGVPRLFLSIEDA